MNQSKHTHNFILNDSSIRTNEKKTLTVAVLTFVTMLVEIIAGYLTGSMALLADGWHMASHVTALGISVMVYKLASSQKLQHQFSFGTGKFIPLGGYTSAIILALMACLMVYESIKRLLQPEFIYFDQAIGVAVIGLVVNLVSALILNDHHDHHHHHHDHAHDDDHSHSHDHNLKAAYLHVLADALTSVFAILALILGKYLHTIWMDAVVGILGAIVILKWAYGLCKETSWELLDGQAKAIDQNKIIQHFERNNCKIHDLHVWRIAPSAYACEIVISSVVTQGSAYYRDILVNDFGLNHVIVEEI